MWWWILIKVDSWFHSSSSGKVCVIKCVGLGCFFYFFQVLVFSARIGSSFVKCVVGCCSEVFLSASEIPVQNSHLLLNIWAQKLAKLYKRWCFGPNLFQRFWNPLTGGKMVFFMLDNPPFRDLFPPWPQTKLSLLLDFKYPTI